MLLPGRNGIFIRMKNPSCILFLLFFIVIIIPYVTSNWDPYEILGVERGASLDQIKRAYRDLARKLHPDKSNLGEDESGRRFIELNKAFSILKDPNRRSRFDQHGDTEESRHSRGYHGQHNRQNRQSREYWNQNGYKTFTFFSSSSGHLKRKSITTKQYYADYLKESKFRPYLMFFYSDSCASCNLIEATWTKITDELAKYNIGSFTINVQHEPHLSQDLGVSSIPHIACLIDGNVKPYYQPELSLANIVKFTKDSLPNNLVTLLRSESEQDRFIALGPQQNRLSAIIIHNENNLKLRYLLIAYELRTYYRFGHVSTKLSKYLLLSNKYNLSIDSRSRQTYLLVFDENIGKPLINTNFKTDNLDIVQLKKQLIKWPFLQLPRLSSQQRFDDLCLYTIPRDGDKTKLRLCVILFATDTPSTLFSRHKLIEFISLNGLSRDDRVVFAYIDPSKQQEFVRLLLLEIGAARTSQPGEPIDSSILMIERQQQSNRKAHYKWLSARWDPKRPNEIDMAKIELHRLITDYTANLHVIQDKVLLGTLVDEEGPGLMDRVFWRFVDYTISSVYFMTSTESFYMVLLLILCAFMTSLFLYQTPIRTQPSYMQDDHDRRKFEPNRENQESPQTVASDEMKILELKAETYNGMVRLLKPGYRSIVLLSDRETKEKLLTEFKKAVWPYRRNKNLLFGYLCLDKNLEWYKSLLQEVLGINNLNVNKKNCIGTVLSLNGFKKYFRVYHAKHHEIDYYDDNTHNDGSFLGFNNDEDDIEIGENQRSNTHQNSSLCETLYTVDNLLDRLPIWLDKMFDGLTKRYYLDSWPDEMK